MGAPNHASVTRFLIVKETTAIQFCKSCKGSGKTYRTFQGRKQETACGMCHGTGRHEIKHRTEVPLEEALNEIHNQNQKK